MVETKLSRQRDAPPKAPTTELRGAGGLN